MRSPLVRQPTCYNHYQISLSYLFLSLNLILTHSFIFVSFLSFLPSTLLFSFLHSFSPSFLFTFHYTLLSFFMSLSPPLHPSSAPSITYRNLFIMLLSPSHPRFVLLILISSTPPLFTRSSYSLLLLLLLLPSHPLPSSVIDNNVTFKTYM